MYAVVGRVKIKSGREEETRAMIANQGIAMVHGMAGSSDGYWARSLDGADLIQHSFWLFDTEDNARSTRREIHGAGSRLHRSRCDVSN